MLEFAEKVLHSVRKLRQETQQIILAGNVRDMEQYRYLMGRLEGYSFVEIEMKKLLEQHKELV
jgi:hypothetical protein